MSYVKIDHYYKSLNNPTLIRKKLPKSVFKEIDKLYGVVSAKDRRNILYNIAKILNNHFGLPNCGLKIYKSNRPHLSGNSDYWLKGQYIQNKRGLPLIRLWNFSENGRRLSSQQILNIFLHEYIHHYDFKHLKIDVDHDIGFLKRLDFLRKMIFKKDE